jgi:hypothetical protein
MPSLIRAGEQAFASPFGCGMTIRQYIATQCLAALTGRYGADQEGLHLTPPGQVKSGRAHRPLRC